MTNYLPKHATAPEACEWLATETGEPWTLARLLENSLTPQVWLDYEPRFPEIFGDRLEGFSTPMLFHGDVVRLAAGGDGVLLTMIRTPDKGIIRVIPGYRAEIDDLRFLRDDITRLAGKHSAPHGTPAAKLEADKGTTAKTNKLIWDDARLRALLDEINHPGVTHKSLGEKYGVSRSRIGALLKEARKKFSIAKSSTYSQLMPGKGHHRGSKY